MAGPRVIAAGGIDKIIEDKIMGIFLSMILSSMILSLLYPVSLQISKLPPFSIFRAEKIRRGPAILRLQPRAVPFKLLAGSIGNVAEQDGLSQHASIGEVARGGAAGFAGQQPFLMVANRGCNRGRRRLEAGESLLGQQLPPIIIGNQHPFVAHK